MSAKFTLKQAEEIAKHVDTALHAALMRALLASAHRVVQHITTEIIPKEPRQPVDRALYRAGWRAQRTSEGADVLNTLPYASIIEYGARAENIKVGKKMLEALEGWIQRKKIGDPSEAKQIAWAIAMAMKKKGIYNGGKGLRILEKALKMFPTFVQEEFENEVKREFGRG